MAIPKASRPLCGPALPAWRFYALRSLFLNSPLLCDMTAHNLVFVQTEMGRTIVADFLQEICTPACELNISAPCSARATATFIRATQIAPTGAISSGPLRPEDDP
jgi:hypothetical protein